MSIFHSVRRAAANGFQRVIDARQSQVNRYVDRMLLNFDDETLAGAGLSRAEVRRRGAASYWI